MLYNIISKGKYNFPQNDRQLTIQNFIFISENGTKYLLLKWKNSRNEILDDLQLMIKFYDASANTIEKKKMFFENLHCNANSTFVLKIEVSEDCVDFEIRLDYSRYGAYTYSSVENGIMEDYNSEAKSLSDKGLPHEKKLKETDFGVSDRKPLISVWIGIFFCALLVGLNVFTCCRLSVFKKNSDSFLKDGVKYSFIYDNAREIKELHVTGYYGNKKVITICDSIDDLPVTEIAYRAFSYNNSIVTVKLEGNLKIDEEAFSNCRNLESINLDNVTSIGRNAFNYCSEMCSVTAYQLEEIGDFAFSCCNRLETVYIGNAEKQLTIDAAPFNDCDCLTSLIIEQQIEYSGYPVIISGYSNIKTLVLKNLPYTYDGQVATVISLLPYAYSLKNLKIDYMDYIPEGFCSGSEIESVEIGHLNDPIVGNLAFSECNNLKEIILPKIRKVGERSFYSTKISSFDGTELEEIGANAFAKCQSLDSFEMGENLKKIGDYAFSDCCFFSVKIPSSVEYIGTGAFLNCNAMNEIYIPFLGNFKESNGRFSDIFEEKVPQTLKNVTITDSLVSINENAFSNCDYLERIVLPNTVTSIGSYAFASCSRLSYIDLSENLISIGDFAFQYCLSLTAFTLPNSLKSIGNGAFESCYHLYEVKNNSQIGITENQFIASQIANYALKVYDAGKEFATKTEKNGYCFAFIDNVWYMIGYPKDAADLVLPQSVGIGKNVYYKIASYLFYKDNYLLSIKIPPSVDDIGEYAFHECNNLQNVVFDGNSSLTVISEAVFSYCFSLSDFLLPESITSIEPDAFAFCGELRSIILPQPLVNIGNQAFLGCFNLKSVYNLSALPLEKGKQNYGNVAYYADNVYTSTEEIVKTETSVSEKQL